MKKFMFFITVLLLLVMSATAYAAGTVTVSGSWQDRYGTQMYVVKFVCTGDAANGSIPTTTIPDSIMSEIKGMFLYIVSAYPTAGGTAPDAADITVLDGTFDVLGAKGVNLIHATARQDVYPYSTFMSNWRYWPITGGLSLAIANQATNSANYTVEFACGR